MAMPSIPCCLRAFAGFAIVNETRMSLCAGLAPFASMHLDDDWLDLTGGLKSMQSKAEHFKLKVAISIFAIQRGLYLIGIMRGAG